jgi:hypothetical protein
MNRIVICAVFLLFIASIAAAQGDAPREEVFGGFSLTHDAHMNLKGAAVEVEHNLNSKFGIVGDFSHGQKSYNAPYAKVGKSRVESLLMGGPRLSYRGESTRIFFHCLVGGVRMKVKGTPPADGLSYTLPFTGLAIAAGGGVDFRINSRIAIRPAQLEWVRERTPGFNATDERIWFNQFRYSAGLVIKFRNQ